MGLFEVKSTKNNHQRALGSGKLNQPQFSPTQQSKSGMEYLKPNRREEASDFFFLSALTLLQSASVRRDDNFLTSRVKLTNLLGFSTTPQCTPMTSRRPDDQMFILQGPEKRNSLWQGFWVNSSSFMSLSASFALTEDLSQV